MKVAINGVIYDSQITPIVLIWETDSERQKTGDEIYNGMDDQDGKGPRLYASYPVHRNGEEVTKEAKELYENISKSQNTKTWWE